jgi:hypothetical protein
MADKGRPHPFRQRPAANSVKKVQHFARGAAMNWQLPSIGKSGGCSRRLIESNSFPFEFISQLAFGHTASGGSSGSTTGKARTPLNGKAQSQQAWRRSSGARWLFRVVSAATGMARRRPEIVKTPAVIGAHIH